MSYYANSCCMLIIQQISQSKYHKPEFYPSLLKGITWIILLACLEKSMVICNVACLEDKKWIIFLQDWAEQKSSQLQSPTYHWCHHIAIIDNLYDDLLFLSLKWLATEIYSWLCNTAYFLNTIQKPSTTCGTFLQNFFVRWDMRKKTTKKELL